MTVLDAPVGCPECRTSRTKPLDVARETINDHNEKLHDGEPVAGIRIRDEDDEIKHYPHPEGANEKVRDRVMEALMAWNEEREG